MPETVTPPRRPAGFPRRWILIGSLCLNLALLGVVGGALLKRPAPAAAPGLWNYGRALPEPYREDLARALRESRRDWIGPREALRGQRAALADALVAEPFDPARVAEVIGREQRLTDSLAARGAGMLLGQINRMSPEDRAAYAEALRRAPERGGDRPPRHGDRP